MIKYTLFFGGGDSSYTVSPRGLFYLLERFVTDDLPVYIAYIMYKFQKSSSHT